MEKGIPLRPFTVAPGHGEGRPRVACTSPRLQWKGKQDHNRSLLFWLRSELADFHALPPAKISPCVATENCPAGSVPILTEGLVLTLAGGCPFFAVIHANLMVC